MNPTGQPPSSAPFRFPSETNGPIAEAFRSLRANLSRQLAAGKRNICLVSSWPGDGKSMACANLAVSLGQLHLRVLLIDGDLRKPTLSRVFGLADRPGLTDALESASSAVPMIYETHLPQLQVLPRGLSEANPANLVGRSCLGEVLRSAQGAADCTIIDTPPLSACSDAFLLAAHCDLTLMVVSPKGWDGDVELRYKQQLAEHGVPLHGVILNGANEKERYGYGYGYGSSKEGYGNYGTSPEPRR